MKYVVMPGEVNDNLFEGIINISSIRSEKVIMSLYEYFVLGFTRNEICSKNGINPGYLSIKIREFHDLYKKIHTIFPVNK